MLNVVFLLWLYLETVLYVYEIVDSRCGYLICRLDFTGQPHSNANAKNLTRYRRETLDCF